MYIYLLISDIFASFILHHIYVFSFCSIRYKSVSKHKYITTETAVKRVIIILILFYFSLVR